MKKISIKYHVLSILGIFVLYTLYILHTTYYISPVFAQACPIPSASPRVIDGLISAAAIISDKFSNAAGICAVDSSKISFAPFKIPTYDDLKSIFFDQSKLPSAQKITLTGNQTQSSIDLSNSPHAPTVTSSKSCLTTNTYSGSELAISWTDALVTQVKISDGTNTWTKNVSSSSTTGPFGFTGATGAFHATVGTTYSFSVSNGTWGPASTFGIPACPPPDNPIVTTSPACIYNADTYPGSEVNISWTDPYVTRVDISTDQNFPAGYWSKTVTTSPTNATNFTSSFNLGTSYYVRLYNSQYNTAPSSFKIDHCSAPAAPAVAVGGPACLNTSTYSGSEITISWNDPNVTQAKITGGSGPWTELNATSPVSAPLGFGTASSFATNTSYTASLYNGVWGASSLQFSIPSCPAPAAPTGLAKSSCTNINTTTATVVLIWNATLNANSYNVQTDGTSGGNPAYSCNASKDETCQTGLTSTSYSRTVTRGVTYGWRVQGSNLSGAGAWTSTTEPWSNTFTCP